MLAASTITGTDNGATNGSTLDLDGFSSITNLNSMTLTGDTDVNNVELSTVLSESKKTTIDFVSDNAADRLIFNLADSSNFVEFNTSDGLVASGSASSFTFNTINNFDVTGEDLLGVFYGGSTSNNEGKFVQQTHDGGYIFIGHSDYDFLIIKTDPQGDI